MGEWLRHLPPIILVGRLKISEGIEQEMKIQFEYPDIWELKIDRIEVVNRDGIVVTALELNKKDNIWHGEASYEGEKVIYKYRVNEYLYINDPYAQDYVIRDGKVWSICYKEKNMKKREFERVEKYDIVMSNQMNRSVQDSKSKKTFYWKYDKKVNVGVEFYFLSDVHELAVVWFEPEQHMYHIDYKVLEPEQEGKPYAMIIWFKMLFDEIEKERLAGVWTVKLLLDGALIGFEQFLVRESYMDDL